MVSRPHFFHAICHARFPAGFQAGFHDMFRDMFPHPPHPHTGQAPLVCAVACPVEMCDMRYGMDSNLRVVHLRLSIVALHLHVTCSVYIVIQSNIETVPRLGSGCQNGFQMGPSCSKMKPTRTNGAPLGAILRSGGSLLSIWRDAFSRSPPARLKPREPGPIPFGVHFVFRSLFSKCRSGKQLRMRMSISQLDQYFFMHEHMRQIRLLSRRQRFRNCTMSTHVKTLCRHKQNRFVFTQRDCGQHVANNAGCQVGWLYPTLQSCGC